MSPFTVERKLWVSKAHNMVLEPELWFVTLFFDVTCTFSHEQNSRLAQVTEPKKMASVEFLIQVTERSTWGVFFGSVLRSACLLGSWMGTRNRKIKHRGPCHHETALLELPTCHQPPAWLEALLRKHWCVLSNVNKSVILSEAECMGSPRKLPHVWPPLRSSAWEHRAELPTWMVFT